MVNTAFNLQNKNKIKGDYAEFGVFKGKTFLEACKAAGKLDVRDMKFWAFDSFQGLPEVKGKDKDGAFYTGEFSYPRNQFVRNLRRYGVDLDSVEIVEGFYEETLTNTENPKELPERIAIAWIDCDLYESTVPVLEFLTNRIVDGGVIIFDDWFCFSSRPDKGEQLACCEWLERNPEFHLSEYQKFHWAGNSFIVNRNAT